MNSAIERLLTLRVRDVMNEEVVTVSEDHTMAEAATVLDQHDISGAPVVDFSGKCVGVLSVADFALREIDRTAESDSERFGMGFEHVVVNRAGSPVQIEAVKENRVAEHMSPVVQTINKDAPVMNAARVLIGEHIHRLVIVDEDDRPVGVLTSLDLVACMVAAIEE